MEPLLDSNGKPLPGSFWEYRVEIRNESSKTVRNVSLTSEHLGQMPIRPRDLIFDKTKKNIGDIKPGQSELVSVVRWPIPIKQEGMLAGRTALEYGPIKLTATGDDSMPTIRVFDFDYQAEPMLRDPAPPPASAPQPSTPVSTADWPDVLLRCNWRGMWDATPQIPVAGHWIVRNRVWELSAPGGGPVYNVQIQDIDLGGLVARFAPVEVLTSETVSRNPVIYDAKTQIQVPTHDLETVLSHPPNNANTKPYARPKGGDQLTAEVPVFVHYSDKTGTHYRVAYVFHYEFLWQAGRIVRANGIEKLSQFPERGDHYHSTSVSRTNPDGSLTFEATVARQIDRRPQLWKELASNFKELTRTPTPIWVDWIYTFETKRYDWWVRHSSEYAVKLCIELCKEGGRLLLAEPPFRQKFPDIAAVTDDGDRWLLAVYKVAGIGKVRASLQSSALGVVTTGEGGEIKDLPGASQVLCQMALNGF